MKVFVIVTIMVSLMGVSHVYGQCSGWTWPSDEAKEKTAKEKFVVYNDALDRGDFRGAVKSWSWLLTHAPNLNTKIYIDGAKIYENLAEVEEDNDRKRELVDSVIMLYDQRAEICGDKNNVLNRKAYTAFRLSYKDPSAYPKMLKYFDDAIDLTGTEFMDVSLLAYMNVIKVNAQSFKNLTDDEILSRYEKISNIIAQKISTGKNVTKLQEWQGTIDGILADIVTIDCGFVKEKLEPKFRENPKDIGLAKKIFAFMLGDKCTDDPLWLEAGKVIYNDSPNYGLAKNIALKCAGNEDYDCAEFYFKESLKHTEDPSIKADVYIEMGKMDSRRGRKATARDKFKTALGQDPSKKEAYTLIGNLYYYSFDECATKEDWVKDRAVFLAAYEMYKMAGNTKQMQAAKEQFPSKSEIFVIGKAKGDPFEVNCWINVTVSIDTRD
jgi:tetratricopeptide (TPR) repeat protein